MGDRAAPSFGEAQPPSTPEDSGLSKGSRVREGSGVPRLVVRLVIAVLVVVGFGAPAARWWDRPAPKVTTKTRPSIYPEMVLLPGGDFTMGSPSDEPGRLDNETLTATTVESFEIARTEVTQAQWDAVMGTNPSYFQGKRGGGDNHPVERVSVWDALAYLNALSERAGLESCYDLSDCSGDPSSGCGSEVVCDGDYRCPVETLSALPRCLGFRLPTSAEWEYAAWAGTQTPLYTGSITLKGKNHAPEVGRIGWYGGNSGVASGGYDCSDWREKEVESKRCGTHAVAGKPAHPWGLHDMIGNVWEWTGTLDADGDVVSRGCGWFNFARFCRAAFRFAGAPGFRNFNLGFRPARSVPQPSNPRPSTTNTSEASE